MRTIERPAVDFPDLSNRTDRLKDLYASNPDLETVKKKIDNQKNVWRTPSVLGALLAMHGEACAYCLAELTASDRGDVEHFRPKSVYWWLAFDFTNYLLSCSRCNRILKRAEFPLASGEAGLKYNDGRDEKSEKRLLLDPTRDPVEELFKLKRGNGTWFIEPVVKLGVNDRQAEATRDFFELNLDKLPGKRQIAIRDAILAARSVRGGGDPDRVKRLASRFKPFGFVIRKVLKRNYEDLLPSMEDEVRFLIHDLKIMLDSYDSSLARDPSHEGTLAQKEQTLYALAIIWKYPPPGINTGKISTWIGNKRRLEVEAFKQKL